MKRIIELCQNYMKTLLDVGSQNQSDLLKLRLRGKGSGFKEGPGQKGIFQYESIIFTKIPLIRIK